MPLHVANQPHQSLSRSCVTERNDVFGIVCSDVVTSQTVSFQQHGVYLYVHLFATVHQLCKLSHTHISLSLSLSLIPLQQLSSHMSAHVRRAAPPIRRRYPTSPRRPTVNHLSTPRRPSAAVAPTAQLVHRLLMGGLLHLVQRGGDGARQQPAQAPPRCTKCNSHPSAASVPITVLLYNGPLLCCFNVPIEGLTENFSL